MGLSQKRQIDVTPAMMVAGFHALAGFDWDMDSALQTVAEIFRAMETERRLSDLDAFDLLTREKKMEMISIRYSLDDHIRSLGFNWHGGGTDLETGQMDLTFDHDGQDYKITLSEMNDPSGEA